MKRSAGWFALFLTFSVLAMPSSADIQSASDLSSPADVRAAAFLTRIRLADPEYRVILIACLKPNELNLLLSRHLRAEEIPVLVKGLAGQLGRVFPGQDLTVVAFRPIVPLREAGIARLNAQTGEVTYFAGTVFERQPGR
jgi:hypothetical protein